MLSQSLYVLIEQQSFFKGLNSHHLQLLTDAALEMKFEPRQAIFAEGSPANWQNCAAAKSSAPPVPWRR
jgi:hypothetical protein